MTEPIKVLIVDDHAMLAESLNRLLSHDPGIQVVGVANTIGDGMELARATGPHVVLMDFHLPDGDGAGATVRLLSEHPDLRVILLTGSESPAFRWQAARAGASAWMRKTQAVHDLIEWVHRVHRGERFDDGDDGDELPRVEDLVVHYQPIVDLRSELVVGFEALVRWQHPERGLLAPGHFLPFAEETGFIVDIDRRVRELALAQLGTWQRELAGRPLFVSVNLSAREFDEPDLELDLRSTLKGIAADAEGLVLEVTSTFGRWNPADSTGEGLSRALAFSIYPAQNAEMRAFETAPTWLAKVNHFGYRLNWIDRSRNTDRDYVSIGCATLFLYWLRYDLHFGWRQILTSHFGLGIFPGDEPIFPTLGEKYQYLTGDTDGWFRFSDRTQHLFPSYRGVPQRPTPSILRADNAFPAELGLVAASGGRVVYSMRASDDTWTEIRSSYSQSGDPGRRISEVTASALDGEIHMAAIAGGKIFYTDNQSGTWSRFRDITPSRTGAGSTPLVLASACVANETHLVLGSESGTLMHSIRHANGKWDPFRNMAQFPQPVTSISSAAVEGELHVAAVHGDTVYHRIRHSDHWDRFVDIKTKTGDPGILREVACTEHRNELHLFAWNGADQLFYAVRSADTGDWIDFQDLLEGLGRPGYINKVGCAEVASELHIIVQTKIAENYHSVLTLDGIWSPLTQVNFPGTRLAGDF